jgi:hypothetical protein
MSNRQEIEAALAAWRDAERRLAGSTDGHNEELRAEVTHHRERFHQLSGDYMRVRIDELKVTEQRRLLARASSDEFHEAAQREKALAAEIWDEARRSDEETPGPAERRGRRP